MILLSLLLIQINTTEIKDTDYNQLINDDKNNKYCYIYIYIYI